MASKDVHLYGVKRKQKSAAPQTTANTNFSSALSALIASSSSASNSTAGRPRPSRTNKDDIFSAHNRNVRKRAAADMLSSSTTKPSKPKSTSDPLDDDDYRRSKRKMEEKARLYAALKRGDVEDDTEKHMVDFDRKWAERHSEDADSDLSSSGDEDDDDDQTPGELVEYVDELGRTRTGTALDARRAQMARSRADGSHDDRFTARPVQPQQLIFGDTVQTQAFGLDETAAERMAELAAQRDREPTPPEAVHYDASKEVRTKGTGFFQFSKDEEIRQEQMRDLEREREETELQRQQQEEEAKARKERRKKEIEERRELLAQKRAGKKADAFLESLSGEMGTSSAKGHDEEHQGVT